MFLKLGKFECQKDIHWSRLGFKMYIFDLSDTRIYLTLNTYRERVHWGLLIFRRHVELREDSGDEVIDAILKRGKESGASEVIKGGH